MAPLFSAENVAVKWSQLQGPVFVDNDCTLDGARLRPGTSLGAGCKVGGEVSASIFQGRANKATMVLWGIAGSGAGSISVHWLPPAT
jgi:hypothetical protein